MSKMNNMATIKCKLHWNPETIIETNKSQTLVFRVAFTVQSNGVFVKGNMITFGFKEIRISVRNKDLTAWGLSFFLPFFLSGLQTNSSLWRWLSEKIKVT